MSDLLILNEQRQVIYTVYNDLVSFSWFGEKTRNFSNDVTFFFSVCGCSEVQLWIPSLSGNKQLCAFLSTEAKSLIKTKYRKEEDQHSLHKILTIYELCVCWITLLCKVSALCFRTRSSKV